MAIINTYDQNVAAGGDRIVIFYHNQETGRASRSMRFSVDRYVDGKRLPTDPKAHWQNYGSKTFHVDWDSVTTKSRSGSPADRRKSALAEATAWAIKKYGPREFVRNRMGDYVEREVNEKFPIPVRKREGSPTQ